MFASGFEMMMSNLMGVKPDEMGNIVKRVMTAIEKGAEDLAYIREKLDAMEQENGNRDGTGESNVDRNINRGTGRNRRRITNGTKHIEL